MPENRLLNWCVCDGSYTPYMGKDNINVPNDWDFFYSDTPFHKIPGGIAAGQPEAVLWNMYHAGADRDVFFTRGVNGNQTGTSHVWKVFADGRPLNFHFVPHTKPNMPTVPGQRYRFAVDLWPDLVDGYDGDQKRRPGDAWACEVRFGFTHGPSIQWGAWLGELDYTRYNQLAFEFTAPELGSLPALQVLGKWRISNNIFIDAAYLTALEPQPQPVPPGPTWLDVADGIQDLGREFADRCAQVAQQIRVMSGAAGEYERPVWEAVPPYSVTTTTIGDVWNRAMGELPALEIEDVR